MGFTYSEAFNLPIWKREWFLDRMQKEINKTNEGDNQAGTRAAHQNDAQTRALQGRHRGQVPARLRRFT